MAVLAPPVQVVTSGAPPFVAVAGGAPPFVAVSGNAPPIQIVASGAPPITLLNDDGSIWAGGAGGVAPVNTVLPVISGTPTVGQTISATTGTWTGSPTPTYTYQWKRAGAAISGATASTYLLVVLDTGALITVTVTATNASGGASATSPSFGMIDPAAAPVLSVASAVDFSDIFVWGQATTDTGSGTLYAVVVPSAATTPSAAQIVAGTDAAGAAAPNANVAVSSTGVKSLLVQGLTAVTAYKVCMTHRLVGQTSNVVTGAFTTDTLVIAFATAGAATNMTASTGSAAFGLNQADPTGGTGALRWTDSNDSVTGQVLATCAVAAFFNGVNKVHLSVKNQGVNGPWMRPVTAAITAIVTTYFNTVTGAIGTNTWTATPVTFDMGSGWWMWSGNANLAGADLAGTLNLNKASGDNLTTLVRNGTAIHDIYNIRITRV